MNQTGAMAGPGGLPEVDPQARFAVPADRVAADVVDDEVIIVNLDTGSYYTTDGAGCAVWQLLAAGLTVGEVAAELRGRYVDDGTIDDYVGALAAFVSGQGLLVPIDAAGAVGGGEVAACPAATAPAPGQVIAGLLGPPAVPEPFVAAPFIDYDDMRTLLLLDPVHDVDDRGWPHAAPGV